MTDATGHGATRWCLRSQRGALLALALAAIATSTMLAASAAAKTPGKTYCFNGVCHRVLTLSETRRRIGKHTSVLASHYSDCKVDPYNPCGLTSSGAVFRPSRADNAASPVYPNGTRLLVWNPSNNRAAVVRIDNAGPYWGNRMLDLSRAAADKLGFRHRGVARLIVQVIAAPTYSEATYRHRREYPPVPGYIGRHESLAAALAVAITSNPSGAQDRPLANVILPVKNTLTPLRRVAVTTSDTTDPISLVAPSGHAMRVPAALARAELPLPLPQQAPAALRRMAALEPRATKRRNRAEEAPAKRRARASASRRPNTEPREKQPSLRKSSAKPAKHDPGISRKSPPAQNRPGTRLEVAMKTAAPRQPTGGATGETASISRTIPSPEPAAAPTPIVVSRPAFKWRRKYFGMNPGGS